MPCRCGRRLSDPWSSHRSPFTCRSRRNCGGRGAPGDGARRPRGGPPASTRASWARGPVLCSAGRRPRQPLRSPRGGACEEDASPHDQAGHGQPGKQQDRGQGQQAPDGQDYTAPSPLAVAPFPNVSPVSSSMVRLWVHPDTKNSARFTKTVSPTLRTTLIRIQNKHPPGTLIAAVRLSP